MKEREEAGEWWGRARHRRMMGKSKRHATDGGVQEAGESKRQACGGVEQDTGE